MLKHAPLAALFLVSALAPAADAQQPRRATYVRLQNDTTEAFEHVRASYPEEVAYDRLEPGEASPWQQVAVAYGYGYLEVFVNGERLVMQPYDMMGLNLGPGRVTYHVTIDAARRLRISAIRER